MALSRTAWQTAITDVSTSAQYALGTLREFQNPTFGPQVWRYVKNGEAATNFVIGNGVMQENGLDKYECVQSGAVANVRFMGVAQHAIAFGSYGFVLADGVGLHLSGGAGTTANTVQIGAAAGTFTDGTAVTSEGIVFANAAAAAAATFQGYIRAL